MSFREFLKEAQNKITIYHGDDFNTTKLEPRWMFHDDANAQEGVGIYFSNKLETAESYGKNVIQIEVDERKLINSHNLVKEELNDKGIKMILEKYRDVDLEDFYYFVSDWIEVYEPEDIEDYHIDEMVDKVKNEQIRNFQIRMAEGMGVENFVQIWNKAFPNIHGVYYPRNKQTGEIWYAIINDKIRVKRHE